MAYWRLFCHIVWTTKGREPWLDEGRQEIVRRVVSTTCRDLGVIVHAVGTMPDHVHVAASIPPTVPLSKAIGRWKGAVSHAINQDAPRAGGEAFAWQAEYGVFSLGERAMPDVLAYVQNQRERHGSGDLWLGLERIEPPNQPTERP